MARITRVEPEILADLLNPQLLVHVESDDGISGTASAGISKYGDGRDTNGSLLFGRNFAEGRGNITLNFDGRTYTGTTSVGTAPQFGGNLTGSGSASGVTGPICL